MYSPYAGIDLLEPPHNYNNKFERAVWDHVKEIWGDDGTSRPVLRSRFDPACAKADRKGGNADVV